MEIKEVSNNVYICQDTGYYLVNACCINLKSHLLFIDTGQNNKIGKKFRKRMEELFGKKESFLTITHANYDHFMGLKAFLDLQVIVSDEFMKQFKKKTQDIKFKWLKKFVPSETYSMNYRVGVNANYVDLTLTGGHTIDSSFAYYPTEKILIAGDNLITDMPYFALHPSADLQKYILCLKSWKELDVEVLIPGHGNIVSWKYVSEVLEYFETLFKFLKEAKRANIPIEKVVEDRDLPPYFEPDPEHWIEEGIKTFYNNL